MESIKETINENGSLLNPRLKSDFLDRHRDLNDLFKRYKDELLNQVEDLRKLQDFSNPEEKLMNIADEIVDITKALSKNYLEIMQLSDDINDQLYSESGFYPSINTKDLTNLMSSFVMPLIDSLQDKVDYIEGNIKNLDDKNKQLEKITNDLSDVLNQNKYYLHNDITVSN